ncbi:MAG TPA: hypothetical protein DER05_00420 [Lutibacter sp.]|nr:hypothetical protein [Lutibacter sp.]
MKLIKNISKTIVLLTIVFGCTNNAELDKEEDLAELAALQEEIELLVDSGVCSENADCNYIAFGSKACGGPKTYLVFSTSINVELLQQKVATYNALDDAFNLKYGVASDCYYVTPPPEVACKDGKCVGIYE